MVPFSIETLSAGRPSLFQAAIAASSDKRLTGSTLADLGILFSFKYLRNSLLIMVYLYYLLKGPAYEIKADAIRTSPVITPKSLERETID
jgi:hypothetical protein